MTDRFTLRCAVYPLFIKDGKILLYKRVNTGWEDGKYGVPGGHLEKDETVLEAACREGKEETGIDLDQKNLEFVHASHRKSNYDYVDLFFKVTKWKGTPKLTEENKSDDFIWANLSNLPENTLEYVKSLARNLKENNLYSEIGW